MTAAPPGTSPTAKLDTLLRSWGASLDGEVVTTRSSWIAPVSWNGGSAIAKVARNADERCGYELMRWWDGRGAARVLACEKDALLLERATNGRCLAQMARSGQDDEACRILCETALALHAPRAVPLPELHRLEHWFQPLFELAAQVGKLELAARTARELLAEPRSVTALHGDLHHGNVLDFGERGWLAIDPHGLVGEQFFDFANIFTNPDLDDPSRPVATRPGRFERRLEVVTEVTGAEPSRMLQWIIAWTGLSAAWFIGDDDHESAEIDLTVNAIAAAALWN